MTRPAKQSQPKQDPKKAALKKSGAGLEDQQLDSVTGGKISEACTPGQHIKNTSITH